MTDVMSSLERRLAAGGIILLDGGTGTEVQARGVPMNGEAWSAVANLMHADVVREIHEDYIRAGAEVVIANSFAAGVGALRDAGLGNRVVEINRAAVALAREARDRAADRPVAVAGSLSRTALQGLSGARHRDRPATSALEAFRLQAGALADAEADLLALEMMGSESDLVPALEAADETGLPVWLGVSIGHVAPDGTLVTVDGVPVDALLDRVADQRADALMVMHTDIGVVEHALPVLSARWKGLLGAYPHVGEWTPPNWVFREIPADVFAARVAAWATRGARALGGCCGIGPDHIAALRRALDSQVLSAEAN